MIRSLLFLLFISLIFACSAKSNFENPNASHYTGLIDKFPIEMEISNNKGQLSGWYHYPHKSIKLQLNGTLSDDFKVKLYETNHKGNVTGVFVGEISELGEIKGKWNNPDRTKILNFSLLRANEVSLIDGMQSLETGVEEKKMFQPSKVKGFSKLALWLSVILILAIGFFVVLFFLKVKRKLKEKPSVIHTKEIEREVHFVNESMDPQSSLEEKKGELFQQFIVEMFLTKSDFFEWLDKAPDAKYGEHYPKSNHNPDLVIKFKNEKQGWEEVIAVECKYRAGHTNYEVFIDKQQKIDNYKRYQKEKDRKTFMAIGFGGKPDEPNKIFVLPIDIVTPNMKMSDLELYSNKKSYFFYDYNKKTLS